MMKTCPVCGQGLMHEQTYTPEHNEDEVRVYRRCSYCGAETEGYWTTWSEIEIAAEGAAILHEDDDTEDID